MQIARAKSDVPVWKVSGPKNGASREKAEDILSFTLLLIETGSL